MASIVEGSRPTPENVTVLLENQDHTLGNSLRYVLMRSKDVSFCGYTIPHPSEERISLRVQTTGRPATDVVLDGLSTLSAASEHMATVFDAALDAYAARTAAK